MVVTQIWLTLVRDNQALPGVSQNSIERHSFDRLFPSYLPHFPTDILATH